LGDSSSDIEIGVTDQNINTNRNNNIAAAPAPKLPPSSYPDSTMTNGAAGNGVKKTAAPLPPGPSPPTGRAPFVPGKRAGTESENVSGAQSSSAANSGPLKIEPLRMYKDSEADAMSQSQDAEDYTLSKHSHMKYEIRETPGLCK
jgi:hypothetical protein